MHESLVVYGFGTHVWDLWGESMIDIFLMQPHIQVCHAFTTWARTQGCPEARRIWMKLIAYVVDQLSGVFERTLKIRRRRTSADHRLNDDQQIVTRANR